ncbi:MAG TPA: hypothetical protein VGZ29_10750 [Terriglobia bacterium]|nr:hypothetical protein [Terriglobia bacterium]
MFKIALHKILFIAIVHTLAFADAYTTNRALKASELNPPEGRYFWAVNGLRYLSPGPLHEMNPLLGRQPGTARLYLQINAQDLVADWLILRSKRLVPPAVFGSTVSIHVYGIADNLRKTGPYSLPPPDPSHPCVGVCQEVRHREKY